MKTTTRLVMLGCAVALCLPKWPGTETDAGKPEAPMTLACLCCQASSLSWNDRFTSGKVDAACTRGFTCAPMEEMAAHTYAAKADQDDLSLPVPRGLPSRFELLRPKLTAHKRVTVSELVNEALDDQVKLLQARRQELERWDRQTQIDFYEWFGTVELRAKELVEKRLAVLLQINARYTVANFRRSPLARDGVFAFVDARDWTRMYLDKAFVQAPPLGENSRAGTLTHEMSHFVVAGRTQDFAYGAGACRGLARRHPVAALQNADNLEYFVEGVR